MTAKRIVVVVLSVLLLAVAVAAAYAKIDSYESWFLAIFFVALLWLALLIPQQKN